MLRLVLAVVGALGVAALVSGCAPVDLLNATIPTQGLTIIRDIPYEPGPRHTLDVYRPDDAAGALPVVVFIYGGAWQTGKKSDYLFVASALARSGFLVMVPDYRLYPQVQFPGFIEDAAAAVAYARTAAASWGGDPTRLFVAGHSAGAHIAAMLALNPRYLAAAGMSRSDLAGVVGIAGPYNFLPIQAPDIQAVFSAAADKRDTQPITFVDGHNPPMLLLAGEADDTVYPANTISLTRAIRAKGGPVEDRLYPDVGHIGIILAFAPGFQGRAPSLNDTVKFIKDTPPVAAAAE
jgi:acetyl esterase/lipase